MVQALNKLKLDGSMSITEQLPQFEALVREYERTSKQVYLDDLKVGAVLSAVPSAVQLHVQMGVQESTTYEKSKQKIIIFYEQATTGGALTQDLSQRQSVPRRPDDGRVQPMDVDQVGSVTKLSERLQGQGRQGQRQIQGQGKRKKKKVLHGLWSHMWKSKGGKGKKGQQVESNETVSSSSFFFFFFFFFFLLLLLLLVLLLLLLLLLLLRSLQDLNGIVW